MNFAKNKTSGNWTKGIEPGKTVTLDAPLPRRAWLTTNCCPLWWKLTLKVVRKQVVHPLAWSSIPICIWNMRTKNIFSASRSTIQFINQVIFTKFPNRSWNNHCLREFNFRKFKIPLNQHEHCLRAPTTQLQLQMFPSILYRMPVPSIFVRIDIQNIVG